MNISKTTIYVGISTGVKILSGVIINKYISVVAGPSGMALIGQLQNFLSIINTIATGGIQKGITTQVSKHREDDDRIRKTINTSFSIGLIFSGLIIIIASVFSSQISELIFYETKSQYLILISSFSVVFFVFNTFVFSTINGFKDVVGYTRLNIMSSLSALFLTSFLIYFFGLEGALLAIILNQLFTSSFIYLSLRKRKWIADIRLSLKVNNEIAKKLFPFSVMTLIGVVGLPVTLMIVRDFLVSKEGLDGAGNWEAVWKISQYYLMVLTTGFGVYLLPTYSAIEEKVKLRREVFKSLGFVFLVSMFLASSIYLFRNFIITFLFDDSFVKVIPYMKWQLLGDVIKVSSWSIGLLLQAKAKATKFVITQIIFNSLFILLVHVLYPIFEQEAVYISYLINYCCHILFIIFICRKILW